MNLSKIKKAYFIGIGGIGVSALVKVCLAMGWQIEGSDLEASEITESFEKLGVKIYLGTHLASRIQRNIDLVIYSPAIIKDNPEIKQAKKLEIKVLSYPQILGDLTKEYWTIAVSGAHGKSTTTAMLACIMIRANLDPTVIIGAKLKEFGNSNARVGHGKYLLIEADEWRASFLNYWPKMVVLTNIEREHLDYYKDLNHILSIFTEYISHLPKDGILIANKDNKPCVEIDFPRKKFYSLGQKEAVILKKILRVPGEHNVYNSLAALTAARQLGIGDKIIFKALSEFFGIWRRFEIIQSKPYILINDYAHHPTEIKATLQAAKEKFPKRRIICIFQPHHEQRTKLFFKDFVQVFSEADKNVDRIILTKIFKVAGRERKKSEVNAYDLVKKIRENNQKAIYLDDFKQIIQDLKREIKPDDVVLVMGAGDIWKLSSELVLNPI